MARNGNELAQMQLSEQGTSWEETDKQQGEDSNQSALARIPKDNDGNPIYEQTDADTAWDAIMEQTEGDEEMAQSVVGSMVADKEKALHDVEKEKIAQSGSVAEKIAAAKEHKKAIENAKAELEHWKEIASVLERRKNSTEEQPTEIGNEESGVSTAQEDNAVPQVEEKNVQNVQEEESNIVTKHDENIAANGKQEYRDNGVSEWYQNLHLSGELDQNNSPFILSPNGQIDFGQITKEHNLPAAPIRLSLVDAENGYIHINHRHGKEIQKAGFKSIEAFVDYVVNNFTRIKKRCFV